MEPSKSYLKNYSKKSVLSVLILFVTLLTCGTYITIPVVKDMPPQVARLMQGKRNLGVVAVPPRINLDSRIDWSSTVQGAVVTAFDKSGYFRLIDLKGRQQRLQEIAHSRGGTTVAQKEIGKEIGADAFLFIEVTNQPKADCKTELKTDLAKAGAGLAALVISKGKDDGGVGIGEKQETGVRIVTVFVTARMVNIESGRQVVHSHSEPYKLYNDAGNTQCPSELEAFDAALKVAGSKIVENLSPRIVQMEVPIESTGEGAPEATLDRVNANLSTGLQWAESRNFERAAKSWNRALELSDNKSYSAYWNLAVYQWSQGDMDKAEEYFNEAEKNAPPGWLDQDKIDVISTFQEEKKRKEKEED